MQTGWVVYSRKPGDILIRFRIDQSTYNVLLVEDQSKLVFRSTTWPPVSDERQLYHYGAIRTHLTESAHNYIMAREKFDVEIFGEITMRGCIPSGISWSDNESQRVEFSYLRLEYVEAGKKIRPGESRSMMMDVPSVKWLQCQEATK